ncbi:MAG: hypothetical protein HQL75_07105 [Magnetococcales bacterium]|nr:hypothetical protein [Magnetococcales bacterium]
MSFLDHVCGLDDEAVPFDRDQLRSEINSEWENFLENVWMTSFMPCLIEILENCPEDLNLRQHVDDLKENFFILYRYAYKIIRNRMAPPEGEKNIVVDIHKLAGAGLFACLYLGPFAFSFISKEDIEKQKGDIIAKPFLRNPRTTSLDPNRAITIEAKYSNELFAFRVGCGIALTELRHRTRIESEQALGIVVTPSSTDGELDRLADTAGSAKFVEDLKYLEMPEDYEKHILRGLSQSYSTGCFDILLWPHIFYWLQLYTMSSRADMAPLVQILKTVNNMPQSSRHCAFS